MNFIHTHHFFFNATAAKIKNLSNLNLDADRTATLSFPPSRPGAR